MLDEIECELQGAVQAAKDLPFWSRYLSANRHRVARDNLGRAIRKASSYYEHWSFSSPAEKESLLDNLREAERIYAAM